MMDCRERKLHVLLLPWLAHGHASPFLELAKKLSDRNLQVSFCSTPIILNSLKETLDEKYFLSLGFVELHLPSLPDLPPHYHTTTGLPPHLMPTLRKAFEMSSPNFCTILDSLKPDILIYDIMKPDIAASSFCHIPLAQFITTGATVASYFAHKFKKDGVEFPFRGIKLQTFHDKQFRDLAKKSLSDASKTDEKERSSDLVLFNTFREFEGKFIDYLQILEDKKILPVGPLVQQVVNGNEDSKIMEWLGKKEKSSIVFVSFGSEYFLSPEEREEVAYGLELSDVHFIWVLRFSNGENVRVEDALPKGYLERVGDKALVVEGWAPQAQILAHSSTGGFVSHCGWNSILESVTCGIPIIAMPMHLDQPINGSLLEDVGVGIGVKRDEDGRLDRNDISQVIRKVMKEEDGQEIRKKAWEIIEKIRVKGEAETDGLVQELVLLCKETKI